MQSLGPFEQQTAARIREQAARDEAKRLDNALASVLASAEGRIAFSWVLGLTGQSTSLSVSDAAVMSMLSGRRDVGLEIIRRLEVVCPEKLDLMTKEERDARRDRNNRERADRADRTAR